MNGNGVAGGGGGSGGGGGGGNGSNANNSNSTSDVINRGGNNCHDTGTGSLQSSAESKLWYFSIKNQIQNFKNQNFIAISKPCCSLTKKLAKKLSNECNIDSELVLQGYLELVVQPGLLPQLLVNVQLIICKKFPIKFFLKKS